MLGCLGKTGRQVDPAAVGGSGGITGVDLDVRDRDVDMRKRSIGRGAGRRIADHRSDTYHP